GEMIVERNPAVATFAIHLAVLIPGTHVDLRPVGDARLLEDVLAYISAVELRYLLIGGLIAQAVEARCAIDDAVQEHPANRVVVVRVLVKRLAIACRGYLHALAQ